MDTHFAGQTLMTIPQVAEIVALSPRAVWHLAATGDLPSIKIGKSRRIRLATLERWLEERERVTTPDTRRNDAGQLHRRPSPDHKASTTHPGD